MQKAYTQFDFLSDLPQELVQSEPISTDFYQEEHREIKAPSDKVKKNFITELDVREAIREELYQKYALDGELKIFLNKAFHDLPFHGKDWQIDIIQCPPDKITDKFLITFKINSHGKSLGQWQLPVRAELWQNAYISLKYIRKGEDLIDRYFKINPIDILRMRGRSVNIQEDLANYVAAQNIPQNDVLIYHDLKRKPDVLKGQIVDLIAIEGGMKISMKAKALEDGIQGEYITVQNMQSKKNIQAEIIGNKILRVYF